MPSYIKNKNVLVIDEKVDLPIYSLSKKGYEKIRGQLKYSLQKELDVFLDPLLNGLELYTEQNINQLAVVEFETKLEQLVCFQDKLKKIKVSTQIMNFIEELKSFYNQKIIFNHNKLFCIDKHFRYLTLSNNILLDAGASIDPTYNHEVFEVKGECRIIDHSKSILIFESTKSSKGAISKDEYFIKELARNAIMTEKGDKVLFIVHKENAKELLKELKKLKLNVHFPVDNEEDCDYEETDLSDYDVAINWFGNIVGKNDYKRFNACCIAATPNIPLAAYVLQYAFSNGLINSLEEINMKVSKYKFENSELENLRKSSIATDTYQALKRVQRSLGPKAKLIVMNTDEDVQDIIIDQLSNINVSNLRKNRIYTPENEKQTYVDKFIAYLKTLTIGKYRKSIVSEKIEMNKKHFNRLYENEKVMKLVNDGYISPPDRKQSIELLKEFR